MSKRAFNVDDFLDSSKVAKSILKFKPKEIILAQGTACKKVMYIKKGHVKLSVVSETGREAAMALLTPGDFFGEGGLVLRSVHFATATAATSVIVMAIDVEEMLRVLHMEHEFSDSFINYMVRRNATIEEDLINQLFNSAEKRLARTLLLLAKYGSIDRPYFVIPTVSQGFLAEMVGTTRQDVNRFMNKFKKLGFIAYDGGLHINDSLLNVLLYDDKNITVESKSHAAKA